MSNIQAKKPPIQNSEEVDSESEAKIYDVVDSPDEDSRKVLSAEPKPSDAFAKTLVSKTENPTKDDVSTAVTQVEYKRNISTSVSSTTSSEQKPVTSNMDNPDLTDDESCGSVSETSGDEEDVDDDNLTEEEYEGTYIPEEKYDARVTKVNNSPLPPLTSCIDTRFVPKEKEYAPNNARVKKLDKSRLAPLMSCIDTRLVPKENDYLRINARVKKVDTSSMPPLTSCIDTRLVPKGKDYAPSNFRVKQRNNNPGPPLTSCIDTRYIPDRPFTKVEKGFLRGSYVENDFNTTKYTNDSDEDNGSHISPGAKNNDFSPTESSRMKKIVKQGSSKSNRLALLEEKSKGKNDRTSRSSKMLEEDARKKVFSKMIAPDKARMMQIDPEWVSMKNFLIEAETRFVEVYSTIYQNPFYETYKARSTEKAIEKELGYFEFMLNCHAKLLEEFKACSSITECCQIILSHKEEIDLHIQDEWKTLNLYSIFKDELLRLNFYNQTNLIVKCYRDVTQRFFQGNPREEVHKLAFELIFKVYKQNLAIKEGLKLIIGHNIPIREVGMVKCQTTINLIKPGFKKKTKENTCIFVTESYIIFADFNEKNFDFVQALLIDQIIMDFNDSKEKITISYGYQMKNQLIINTTSGKVYHDIKKSLESRPIRQDGF